jgi:anti-sigma factor RsiW
MTCAGRDQDLLLLTHGELGAARRTFLEAHLRRCPRCREQRERFSILSRAAAGAIRGSDLPAWTPSPRDRRAPASPVLRWSVAAALILVLALVTASAALWLPELSTSRKSRQPNSAVLPVENSNCGSCHSTLPAGHPPTH